MSILSSIATVLFGQGRSIAGIVPDVVIEERHNDTMVITDHPVQVGHPISDHAYQQPPELVMKIGWSDSSMLLNSVMSGSIFSGITSLNDMYQTLLDLMQQAEPLDITTGKRQYDNMVIKSLAVTTDKATENALVVTATFRKVFIVDTQTATLTADNQASPEKTAPVTNGGTRMPVPQQKQSVAYSMFGG